MAINTTESLKPGANVPGDKGADKKAALADKPKAEAPKPEASHAADPDVITSTKKAIEKQDKVEVYIPRARGNQTVQINGVNFTTPAGVKTEVPADVAALLRGSGALDLPPGV